MKNKVNPSRSQIQSSMADRIEQYQNQREAIARYLEKNPNAPSEQLEKDKNDISASINDLEDIFECVIPFIRKLNEYAPNALEQDRNSACYFLFGKVSRTWQAIFALARGGFHYEIMELLRSNREAIDLVYHFLLSDKAASDLTKWFSGKIISNEEARKSMHEYVNKDTDKITLSDVFKEIKSGVYSMFSSYSHVSYAALLDSYNVFENDFDFTGVSGFHYTKSSSLPFARGELLALVDTLRMFYLKVEDSPSFDSLTRIRTDISPEIFNREKFEDLAKEIARKYSSNL